MDLHEQQRTEKPLFQYFVTKHSDFLLFGNFANDQGYTSYQQRQANDHDIHTEIG